MTKNSLLAGMLCVLLGASAKGAVYTDFSGPFAPPSWQTFAGSTSTGTVDTSGAPAAILLVGSNNPGAGDPFVRYTGDGMLLFTILAPYSGTVSFDWDFLNTDTDDGFDFGGFYLNGTFTDLSSGLSGNESGSAQFFVTSGTFGFYVDPTDNTFGGGNLTISNFEFATIPEPGTMGLIGTSLILLAGFRLRRRS
jgi:hypothetical protein